jgi:hypothetical protein
MTDPTAVLPEWQTCGATASFAMFGSHAGPCQLAAGHEGMHDTGSGVRWLLTMPNPEEATETRLLREAHRVLAEVTADRDRLAARVAELEQFQTARKADDRQIDRVLAMLLLRPGGRVEFTAAEMQDAPAHGEFVCCENLLTGGMVLAFQASDVDMSKPDREIVIGAGSSETSALTHCPTCGAPEWHEDGRRGWNPVDVECEDCAGTWNTRDEADDDD